MEREAERGWRGRAPCSTKTRNGGFIIRVLTVENRNGFFTFVEMSETSCTPTLQDEIRILKHIQLEQVKKKMKSVLKCTVVA